MTRRICSAVFALAASALLSGCISLQSYIDPALPPAGRESVTPLANPQPIQALYEFRTKGEVNARATEATNTLVMDLLRGSGLFSEVSASPVANQRRLMISIENVPVTSESDAKAKGFGTGLTFGLVGTMVTDGYRCDATLSAPGGQSRKVNFTHALHTTIGNAAGPPGLTGQKPDDAVKAIVKQLTWSVLRDLSKSGGL